MRHKHFLSLKEYNRKDLEEIFALTTKLKERRRDYAHALEGRTLAMIFQKPSTRTRVSFEAGVAQMGGHALYLGANDIQLHRGETVADTARVLSRYVDAIMARVFAHKDLLELARHGSVPVINGLSDLLHPVQALADYYTLLERRGSLEGLKVAYVGDGNNMCHALLMGAVTLGASIEIATPKGYEPNAAILKSAVREAAAAGTPEPIVTIDPKAAVAGADCVYTDVWASMGQEGESEKRRAAFEGFQVTARMMKAAGRKAVFMHCLPAHRGEEVGAEVIDGPQSVVFDQAENRLHVQKALLLLLLRVL
jgi:ornithine carbamoyltransferase